MMTEIDTTIETLRAVIRTQYRAIQNLQLALDIYQHELQARGLERTIQSILLMNPQVSCRAVHAAVGGDRRTVERLIERVKTNPTELTRT